MTDKIYKTSTQVYGDGYRGAVILWRGGQEIATWYCNKTRFTREEAKQDANQLAERMVSNQ